MRKCLCIMVFVLLSPTVEQAADKKESNMDLPIKAKLVAKKTDYRLDFGGKTADQFRQLLKTAEETGECPQPPKVELMLELTNATKQPIKLWFKGDPVVVTLELKGPGAINVTPRRAFTQQFRVPEAVELAPGKMLTIPITSLNHGFRGSAQCAYWLQPGEYTLKATFATALSPAPKGSQEADEGFGKVNIVSQPITLKVEGQ